MESKIVIFAQSSFCNLGIRNIDINKAVKNSYQQCKTVIVNAYFYYAVVKFRDVPGSSSFAKCRETILNTQR